MCVCVRVCTCVLVGVMCMLSEFTFSIFIRSGTTDSVSHSGGDNMLSD